MSRRSIHRRRRAQGGCLSLAIGILVVAALALVAAIILSRQLSLSRDKDVLQGGGATDSGYVDVNNLDAGAHDMVLSPREFLREGEDIPVLTPAPTPSPEPSPTPEPTYNPDDPYALVRPQPTQAGFLPLFSKANTDEMMIAITLDECSGATITNEFVEAAFEHGAKLTLFPTGENVMKAGMEDVLRTCFYTLGFEIENRCYSAMAKLYMLNDTMMASEIWKQSIAVSYVLGVRHHPHFLRLYGGDGENDLRTHIYLAQEGYYGIAHWTYNGSLMEEGRIGNNLAPGNIYYFKTTKDDLRRMNLLMDEAKIQGFEMVTLNRLFGYEENTFDRVNNVLADAMPELRTKVPYYFMKPGDCTWATNLLQRRLTQLGYLPEDSADGVFGSSTAAALSAFQARMGLVATGAADIETQEKLFAKDAPSVDE